MAVKAVAQILGQFTIDVNGDINIPFYIKALESGEDGGFSYGPVAPNQFTEANLAEWVKDTANNSLNADIGILDTVKIVSGVGGLL